MVTRIGKPALGALGFTNLRRKKVSNLIHFKRMKFLLYTVLDIDFYLSHEVKLTASTPQSSLTCFDSGET